MSWWSKGDGAAAHLPSGDPDGTLGATEGLFHVYGEMWNNKMQFMIDPLTDAEAERRYAVATEAMAVAIGTEPLASADVTVGAPAPEGNPAECWIMIYADHEFGVQFCNFWGTREEKYVFRRHRDRLFLKGVVAYEFADQTRKVADNTWTRATEHLFKPDGYSRQVIRTANPDGSHDVTMTEYQGGDYTHHLLDVPTFGDWAPLLRRPWHSPTNH